MGVDWAEVTAIATSILALSLLGAFGATIFAPLFEGLVGKLRQAL
jgi:hypothetical protein